MTRRRPASVRNPLRRMLVVQRVPRRWPFALRAAFCIAVPVLVGWAAGDLGAGLIATLGAFTSLYGSGRPFGIRAVHLAVIVVCFAVVVALGDWVSGVTWLAVLTVSVIAAVATLLCNALAVGPPVRTYSC